MPHIVRRSLAFILLATLITACDAGGSTNAESDPTVEPSAGSPAVESTGHEQPAPGGGKKPAVEMAGGPAGEAGYSENDDGSVCMSVSWLGGRDEANLGAGISFEDTEVHLEGADRADASCGGDSCDGFTFDSNSDQCRYAVRPGKSRGSLSMSGRVRCSASPDDCAEFR
jgi:hypothetical protein